MVEANRDSAVLWNSAPNTGARSFSVSTVSRPLGVFFHRLKKNRNANTPPSTMYQNDLNSSDMVRSTRVGSGRLPPSES